MKTLSIVLLLFLVGCDNLDRNDPSVVATNKANLSGGGVTVGTLPDGRKVIRYPIHMGSRMHQHWLYVVDNTITINHTESHGKTTSNHVEVMIDGVLYSPVKPEESQP